jgi:endogenous inhibitor of DNA gyrase (YacG/DUF329 family)
MKRKLSVFRCEECGNEVEIGYFGVPHTSHVACTECEKNMKSIPKSESKYDYDQE